MLYIIATRDYARCRYCLMILMPAHARAAHGADISLMRAVYQIESERDGALLMMARY